MLSGVQDAGVRLADKRILVPAARVKEKAKQQQQENTEEQ
jgi:hypothetical protein